MDWKEILMNDSKLLDDFEKHGTPLSDSESSGYLIPSRSTGEAPEFNIEKVKCEVCYEIIGKIIMENFKVPMTGHMFISKDSKHGYPRPFVHDFDWVDLRCPICRHRPFLNENFFINEKNEKCGNTFECDVCGKFLKNKLALYGHRNAHLEKKT